ncbi:FliM/FliN family flagellar motor switch protein [Sinorhizobium sp. BG8]|uniref:FliM/FliN family flagellar motor switch protein n=1 Tax=Sinorhizobium sp. BG8 TaxID=2613773 RepID=UPI00193D0BC3|nr:FliM/FliN family flagellar motor switch protein [Sinorhizobium sp. BG8]QRM54222.1 flagellar motor switch protein FliM [Sinorhizobium sp. BG8]
MDGQTLSQTPTFDPIVLARLTGQLGDKATISKLCASLGAAFAEFLPDLFEGELGFEVAVSYAGFEVGRFDELVGGLGGAMALSDCSLRDWCDRFTIICDSPFIITLVENMLGAVSDAVEEPQPRPLSRIELDVAAMIFDRISNVLKMAVSGSNGYEPNVGLAYNAEERKAAEDGTDEAHVGVVNMAVGIGPVLSTFSVVVPQHVLLKSKITVPQAANAPKTRKEWSDQLGEQVRRSKVTLEARIRLESQTLDTVSRLQAGDIIPFKEAGDVRVDVSANGQKLYVCEFGRSGARYTVRVKDTYGSEEDLLQHIIG